MYLLTVYEIDILEENGFIVFDEIDSEGIPYQIVEKWNLGKREFSMDVWDAKDYVKKIQKDKDEIKNDMKKVTFDEDKMYWKRLTKQHFHAKIEECKSSNEIEDLILSGKIFC